MSAVCVHAKIASIGASSLSPVAFPTFIVRACLRMLSSVMGSVVAGISGSRELLLRHIKLWYS
jgi:hypothetical protein